jgi:methionine synthase II (cobalamin-independent)
MQRSTHRILTTHCGSLPRPDDLLEMLMAREQGSVHDLQAFHARLCEAIGACVRKQREASLDIVNDGEWSKPDYSTYVKNRFTVFEDVKLPDGKCRVPGVIDSTTNFIEHPELVAQRIVRYTDVAGRENVVAGVDCGFATFAGAPTVVPTIAWAKLGALTEGARLASKKLWARPT